MELSLDRIELLDKEKHASLKVDTQNFSDAIFHANVACVMPVELPQLVLEYPIFITQSPTSNQYQFSVLLGLESGQNLYIEQKKWNAKFLPLDILRRPFNLILSEDQSDEQGFIAIDTACSMINLEKGSAIFNSDGSPTKFFNRIKASFSELMKGAKQTEQMLSVAQDFELIEPVSIEYEVNDQPYIRGGMFSISNEKLRSLSPEKLHRCNQLGLLKASVLMETSRVHVSELIKKSHPSF